MRREYRHPRPGLPGAISVEVQAISTPSPFAAPSAGIDYFFAVRPDEPARSAIAETAARFRQAQRFSGVSVPVASLHLALCPMGRTELLRQPLEPALLAAGASVHATGFVATLDTAMRPIGKDGEFPFVLRADQATTQATLALRATIAEAQRRVGLHVAGVSGFQPHVALQYGPAIDAVEGSIVPIQWPVREFVLLRSYFGQYRHEVIGRWPLAFALRPVPGRIDMLAELANLPELPAFTDEYE